MVEQSRTHLDTTSARRSTGRVGSSEFSWRLPFAWFQNRPFERRDGFDLIRVSWPWQRSGFSPIPDLTAAAVEVVTPLNDGPGYSLVEVEDVLGANVDLRLDRLAKRAEDLGGRIDESIDWPPRILEHRPIFRFGVDPRRLVEIGQGLLVRAGPTAFDGALLVEATSGAIELYGPAGSDQELTRFLDASPELPASVRSHPWHSILKAAFDPAGLLAPY